jgi:hypothetical protein
MGAPKPCLGFPSRTAAVLALRKKGVPTEINTARVANAQATSRKGP